MAFPTIPTVAGGDLLSSTTSAASTTHTFPNLSSLRGGAGPQAGDLLIAICLQYQGGTAGAEFGSWGASFTETADLATATALDAAIGVAHKVAAGTESGTFTVTSAHSFKSVNFLMRIPAATWHGTTIPEVLAAVRATGAVSNPGSFDPAGWAAEDTLWIAVAAHTETSTTGSPPTLDTPPTNYTGQLIVARAADAVGDITAGVAFRQLNASAEDVGTWAVTNATRGNGIATVIAIRPKLIDNRDGNVVATGGGAVATPGQHGGQRAAAETGGGVVVLASSGGHTKTTALTGGGVTAIATSGAHAKAVGALTGGGAVTLASGKLVEKILALTGGGVVALARRKDALRAIVETGGGVVTTIRQKGALRAIAETASGVVNLARSGAHAAASTLTGGGVVTTIRQKGALRAIAETGSGVVAFARSKGGSSSVVLTGGGVVTTVRVKGALRAIVETGGGVVTLAYSVFTGGGARTGVLVATGGGTVAFARLKGGSVSIVERGGGVIAVAVQTGRLAAVAVRGGGVVTLAGRTAREAAFTILGGGAVHFTATAYAPTAAELLAAAATTAHGGDGRAARRWLIDTATDAARKGRKASGLVYASPGQRRRLARLHTEAALVIDPTVDGDTLAQLVATLGLS